MRAGLSVNNVIAQSLLVTDTSQFAVDILSDVSGKAWKIATLPLGVPLSPSQIRGKIWGQWQGGFTEVNACGLVFVSGWDGIRVKTLYRGRE